MRNKFHLIDKQILATVIYIYSILITVFGLLEFFLEWTPKMKLVALISLFFIAVFVYLIVIFVKNKSKKVRLKIGETEVVIEEGDIFEYPDSYYKVIAFNEYFDTRVDDHIISSKSLNGKYINRMYCDGPQDLDQKIKEQLKGKRGNRNKEREVAGKQYQYPLGSIVVDGEYFLVAFTRFDQYNHARLELPELLFCLINMWKEIDDHKNNNSIVLPLLGSGQTTRIPKIQLTDQDLLEIILDTIRISRIHIKKPNTITIALEKHRLKTIDIYRIKQLYANR